MIKDESEWFSSKFMEKRQLQQHGILLNLKFAMAQPRAC